MVQVVVIWKSVWVTATQYVGRGLKFKVTDCNQKIALNYTELHLQVYLERLIHLEWQNKQYTQIKCLLMLLYINLTKFNDHTYAQASSSPRLRRGTLSTLAAARRNPYFSFRAEISDGKKSLNTSEFENSLNV